jgi:hypothetical protein
VPGALWVSPLEAELLGVFKNGDWMSSEKIAAAIGQTSDLERLKIILSNLAERRVLDSRPGKGYRLPASPP